MRIKSASISSASSPTIQHPTIFKNADRPIWARRNRIDGANGRGNDLRGPRWAISVGASSRVGVFPLVPATIGLRKSWSPKAVVLSQPARSAVVDQTLKELPNTVLALSDNCQCRDRLFRSIIVLDWTERFGIALLSRQPRRLELL